MQARTSARHRAASGGHGQLTWQLQSFQCFNGWRRLQERVRVQLSLLKAVLVSHVQRAMVLYTLPKWNVCQ